MRKEEFFFSFESENSCSRLGKKCGDFKDGKLTEYHNFLSGSYR
jgi:hypothetical protein